MTKTKTNNFIDICYIYYYFYGKFFVKKFISKSTLINIFFKKVLFPFKAPFTIVNYFPIPQI